MAFSIPTVFQQSLRPASYNGAGFHVVDAAIKGGRRVADHEYPFRDINFAEDLGRMGRTWVFTGFLVGDNPFLTQQYDALLTALETHGPGTLKHPMLGEKQVVCTGYESEQNIAGRYVEIRMTFLDAGQIINPSTDADNQAASKQSADNAQSSSQSSFNSDLSSFGTTDVTAGTQFGTASNTTTLPPAENLNPAENGDSSIPHASELPDSRVFNDLGDTAVQQGATGFEAVA